MHPYISYALRFHAVSEIGIIKKVLPMLTRSGLLARWSPSKDSAQSNAPLELDNVYTVLALNARSP